MSGGGPPGGAHSLTALPAALPRQPPALLRPCHRLVAHSVHLAASWEAPQGLFKPLATRAPHPAAMALQLAGAGVLPVPALPQQGQGAGMQHFTHQQWLDMIRSLLEVIAGRSGSWARPSASAARAQCTGLRRRLLPPRGRLPLSCRLARRLAAALLLTPLAFAPPAPPPQPRRAPSRRRRPAPRHWRQPTLRTRSGWGWRSTRCACCASIRWRCPRCTWWTARWKPTATAPPAPSPLWRRQAGLWRRRRGRAMVSCCPCWPKR